MTAAKLAQKLTRLISKFNTFVALKLQKLAGRTAYDIETMIGQIEKNNDIAVIVQDAIAVVSTKEFSAAIAAVSKHIPKRPRHAILSTILIELSNSTLTLKSFDLNNGLVVTIPVEGQGSAAIAIPAYTFNNWLKTVSAGQLTIKFLDEKTISIDTDSGTQKWAGVEAIEFPELPNLSDAKNIEINIPIKQLRDSVKMVKKFIKKRDTNILEGINLGSDTQELRFIATNGHIATESRIQWAGEKFDAVIQIEALEDMLKTETRVLTLGEDWLGVKSIQSGATYQSFYRRIEGKYPTIPTFKFQPLASQVSRKWLRNQLEIAGLFGETVELAVNAEDQSLRVWSSCSNGEIDATTLAQINVGTALIVNIKRLLTLVKSESDVYLDLRFCLHGNDGALAIRENVVSAKTAYQDAIAA